MKILVGYVTRLHSSGVDKYLLNFLQIAQEQGVILDFLTSQYDTDTERELSEYGCNLFSISSLKNPLDHYRDVKAILQQGKYDKAYFNISEPLNMMGAMAAHNCGVQCIVHSHSAGMDTANRIKRMIRGLINLICRPFLTRSADLYFACSINAAKWLFSQRALKSDKYHTIYNAVDLSAFSYDSTSRSAVRKELNIDDNTLVVGHIGSYCYVKNNFFLADIANELSLIQPDSIMLCIGDGDDREAVQQYATSIGADKYMRFLGVQRNIPSLLSAMDVFVLPSRFEGAPIVAIEAQATGVPCLISDTVTNEVVISSATKQLPIDSAKPWAESIVSMKKCKDVGILPDMIERYSLDCQKNKIINLIFNGDNL